MEPPLAIFRITKRKSECITVHGSALTSVSALPPRPSWRAGRPLPAKSILGRPVARRGIARHTLPDQLVTISSSSTKRLDIALPHKTRVLTR
jgi:hypothetical protein